MRYVFVIVALLLVLDNAVTEALAEMRGRAWLGLKVESGKTDHNVATKFGVLIVSVEPGSPGASAGLRRGDIIIGMNDKRVGNQEDYVAALTSIAVGTRVDIDFIRGRQGQSVVATVLPEPRTNQAAGKVVPYLMLDTDGHTALLRDVTFTRDGKHVVSAGDDKLIRVWDLGFDDPSRAGTTIRTIRGEIGPGDEGRVYAMALSEIGNRKWLAAGGRMGIAGETGQHVRLYDFDTGELKTLLKGHANVVNSLAFSPDGQLLVSGGTDRTAIIWDVASGKLLHRLAGHEDAIYAVGVSADGAHAVTASYDKTLRLWRVGDGVEIAVLRGHKDRIRSLAINPADGTIASGSFDGEVRLWDGKTGAYLRTVVEHGPGVGRLVFTPDGERLLVSTICNKCGGLAEIKVFDVPQGKVLTVYRGHDNSVFAAAVGPDGLRAATGGGDQRAIHVWDIETGARLAGTDDQPITLRGVGVTIFAVGFSRDGRRIAWGKTDAGSHNAQREAYEFQLRLPSGNVSLGNRVDRVLDGITPDACANDAADCKTSSQYLRATAELKGYSISRRSLGDDRYDDSILDIRKGKQVVASIKRGPSDGYGHKAYTLVPNGSRIISGGVNGQLAAYDLSGKLLGRFVGHDDVIWAVGVSPDGRLLISASADQTIRLWNPRTYELIVTLFHGSRDEWVMWTPQGFYTGSGNGGSLLGWQLNNGPANAAEYVRGLQLRQRLHRPDIVERAILLGSGKAASNELDLQNTDLASLLLRRPPVLRAEAPLEASGGYSTIRLRFAPNALPVTSIKVIVNDRNTQTRPKSLPSGTEGEAREPNSVVLALETPLFADANRVQVIAENELGSSEPQILFIHHNGEGALNTRGSLWLIAVGVDSYPGLPPRCGRMCCKSCDLAYAGNDARGFAAAVVRFMGPLHQKLVEPVLLINGSDATKEPTYDNIIAALQGIASKAGSNDTVVLFLAGHGENGPDGRYFFLPTDVSRPASNASGRGKNILDWAEVQKAFNEMKGRRLLFLDACHSANSFYRKLSEDARVGAFAAFVSAGVDQWAEETDAETHGVFTSALIAGLNGKAKEPHENVVTVNRLGIYVMDYVSQLTTGRQVPEFYPGPGLGNAVLVRSTIQEQK